MGNGLSNGCILWEGISQIGRNKIVVILTGIRYPSNNLKTGVMSQMHIMNQTIHPVATRHNAGYRQSICGGCKFGAANVCYVEWWREIANIWKTYRAGRYPSLTAATRYLISNPNLPIRWGASGDPGAIPPEPCQDIRTIQPEGNGYTHQWRTRPDLKAFCMASVDNIDEARQAQSLGWRTYRVIMPGGELLPSEIMCPTPSVQCNRCLLCGGVEGRGGKSIASVRHGSPGKVRKFDAGRMDR